MRPLTIELTKGTQRKFQSIGWKTPKGDDCRRHFYALDQTGKPVVVMPKPAMPEFYDPNRRAKAVFTGEPFPEAVCVEISPCRLLAPPCYRTQEELDGVFLSLPTFDPWQWVYWQKHKEFSILEPADEGPLKERMDKWLAKMRAAYEYEAGALRDRIKQVTTATLQELGLDTEEQRAKRLGELRAQLDIVESEDRIDGVPCKGRLKLTLEEVKRGAEGIRDAYMHEDWAKKNGEDLRVMAHERRAFRRWLETHTGTRANIIDATTGPSQVRQGIEPPHFGEEYEQNPQFLEACACVRYRARFSDNAGTVVYLADCETREELTAEERDEAAKLTGAGNLQTQSTTKLDAAASAPQTHTPDLQFEYVNVEGTEWRKAGPQMVRRRELAEHQRTTKDDSAFRSLLELHKERWFYPVKRIGKVREAAKCRKASRVAAMFDITDWDSNWRPKGVFTALRAPRGFQT
jgi:hypothetical protein